VLLGNDFFGLWKWLVFLQVPSMSKEAIFLICRCWVSRNLWVWLL